MVEAMYQRSPDFFPKNFKSDFSLYLRKNLPSILHNFQHLSTHFMKTLANSAKKSWAPLLHFDGKTERKRMPSTLKFVFLQCAVPLYLLYVDINTLFVKFVLEKKFVC